MDKDIRFTNSEYIELFRIPDGGEIIIRRIYDQLETKYRCRYIDEYHFELINTNNNYSNVFHIHQFAELMAKNENIYEPVLHGEYKLEAPLSDEAEFAVPRSDAGSIGIFQIEFGADNRMHTGWTEKNDTLNTDTFHEELLDVFNCFRLKSETPILRNPTDIYRICKTVDSLTKDSRGNDTNIFKVHTDRYTYYMRYRKASAAFDTHRINIYCYDNAELDRYRDVQFIDQTYGELTADKFF